MNPLVSVVVPTFRRDDLLARCLDTLRAEVQTGGRDLASRDTVETSYVASSNRRAIYEVIVTDDAACKETEIMVMQQFPDVCYVHGPGKGPAANRNNGARHANGDWIAFVDDDCIPGERWIASLRDVIESQNVEVVEGRTVCPGKQDSPLEEHVENLGGGMYWSCNLAVKKEAFERLGGFDEMFEEAGGEDMEFAWRIKNAGSKAIFAPEFSVEHPPRTLTWRKVWWRTFMIRWILLYRYKTGSATPLSESRFNAVRDVAFGHLETVVRHTWRFVKRPFFGLWRRAAFWTAWQWITLPLVLPYLMRWEVKFRGQFTEARTHRKE